MMTKKELYHLSVRLSSKVLAGFFGTNEDGFANMETNHMRKQARKNLYEALAPLLLNEEPKDLGKEIGKKEGE